MGLFATGVTVVTAPQDGEVHGMTANAFTSVSLDPPLILVSIDKRARMHSILPDVERFGVTVLVSDQEDISNHFAGQRSQKVIERLEYDWTDGIPVLKGGIASMACHLWASYDGGDHTLFVGRVVHLDASDGDPLLYFRSKYRNIAK